MSSTLTRPALAVLAALALAGCTSSHPDTSATSTTGGAAGTTSGGGAASTGTTGGGSTAAATSGGSGSSGSTGITTPYTFWHDVAPILENRCVKCHTEGAIGPYPLRNYTEVFPHRFDMLDALDPDTADLLGLEVMPPWPPASACNSYEHDRSLTDDERNVLHSWATGGGPEGDGAGPDLEVPDAGPALAHIDETLSMPHTFMPDVTPDDYHCFLIPWTPTATKYVTGLTVRPGNAKIVHHVIAYFAGPSDASKYTALDNGNGYTCFGGAGADDSAQWLAAWAPGAAGGEFPAGTGIRIDPGSVIILQVHYNVANGPGETDFTAVDLELADSVQKQAVTLPFLDPNWYNGNMPVPAGQADVVHSYSVDLTPYLSYVTNGVLLANQPFTIYAVGAHMHLRGKHETIQIGRSDGSTTCLLDVPDWDFHWQGAYTFNQPVGFNPGDTLSETCHWDNSQQGQPLFPDGGQPVPADLNWGEGTNDEMCLGVLYLTQ